MASSFRIPKAAIKGPYGALMKSWSRRLYGDVPDPGYVLWHHQPVLRTMMGFERKVANWGRLDPHLKAYAVMVSAAVIGCSWCLDFGYFMAHTDGLDEAKVREVPRWRQSSRFTDLERGVMAYAEAMTTTPTTVTDEQVSALIDHLGAAAVVELTQMIAIENMRSRFNLAAGLESQGFSDVCERPLATTPLESP